MEVNVAENREDNLDVNVEKNSEIIIEEVSRNHKLLHRHKLTSPVITIGRGYQNDIILSDPHVCAEHVKISFDEDHWQVSDKQSINGTFLEDGKQNADQHVIKNGDVICLGKSQLRLIFTDQPVAPTVAFSPFESFINLMRQPFALLLTVAVFTLIAGGVIYLSKPAVVNFSQLFVPAIGMTLLFALWPSGVALISHLTKHDARIMAQLGISFTFFNLMWFSDIFESIIVFNSSSNIALTILASMIPIALAFCLFWLNGYIGFHMTAKRRITVALSITAILFGGSYLVEYSNKPEFSARPHYNATLMAPSFLIASSSTVDEFIKDSSKLFAKATKEVEKAKEE
ncbi:MAG: FHA domain-containing protein [Colwellia sp.]